MAIEDYRSLAEKDSRSLFRFAFRVETNERGRVVPARESWRNRFVAWINQVPLGADKNCEEIGRFRHALVKEYGEDIAARIDRSHLENRRNCGGNLSSRTIRLALKDAEKQRMIQIRRILETSGAGSDRATALKLEAAFNCYNKPGDAPLSEAECRQLRQALRSELWAHPLFGTAGMDDRTVQDIQDKVVRSFIAARRSAALFQTDAVFWPHTGETHAPENAEQAVAVLLGVPESDSPWADQVSAIAKVGQETAALLQEDPREETVLRKLQNDLRNLEARRAFVHRGLPGDNSAIRENAHHLLQAMHDAIAARLSQLAILDIPFGTSENLRETVDTEYRTAEILWENLRKADRGDAATQHLSQNELSTEGTVESATPESGFLDTLHQARNRDLERIRQADEGGGGKLSAEEAGKIMRNIRARLLSALRPEYAERGRSSSDLRADFKEALLQARNENPRWTAFSSDTRYRDDKGHGHIVVSELTPAAELGTLRKEYAGGLPGVCSGSYGKTAHATNLWTDRLRDSTGQPLCSLVRSGAHSKPKGAEEMFLACCQNQSEEILRRVQAGVRQPIEVPFVDMGLLSTTVWAGESGHIKSHLMAIRSLRGKPFTVTLSDGVSVSEVTVVARPLAFNFGMRSCDFGFIGKVTSDLPLEELSERSLQTLIGSFDPYHKPGGLVGAFLEGRPGLDDTRRRAITDLVRQIRELQSTGAAREDDADYYKFAARICLLADMTGVVPCIHCKSGKDRTARLIEEIKLLACEIHDTGQVPLWGSRSPGHQSRSAAFAISSGNGRIQELNTGYHGNKQHKAFKRIMPDEGIIPQMERDYYRGWSSNAKS